MESLAAIALAWFTLSSPAVPNGGTIPARYTCDGTGVSLPLRWTAPPAGTHSLSLIVVDPDVPSGRFVHWSASGIPPRAGGVGQGNHFAHEGTNGFGKRGWGPPCPPRGRSHRYLFVLNALDAHGRTIAAAGMITHYQRQ
jgi:Raf kinase inhibitor-like YbhB/YbcL family protein